MTTYISLCYQDTCVGENARVCGTNQQRVQLPHAWRDIALEPVPRKLIHNIRCPLTGEKRNPIPLGRAPCLVQSRTPRADTETWYS